MEYTCEFKQIFKQSWSNLSPNDIDGQIHEVNLIGAPCKGPIEVSIVYSILTQFPVGGIYYWIDVMKPDSKAIINEVAEKENKRSNTL